jgi:hypothetical protein
MSAQRLASLINRNGRLEFNVAFLKSIDDRFKLLEGIFEAQFGDVSVAG